MKNIKERIHDSVFKTIHSNSLIYNTCWEDPRIDRKLLKFDEKSEVVMITSAGCNALDYLFDNPRRINCIDMNAKQNALLELKCALIKRGNYEDLFLMFGEGKHPRIQAIYAEVRPSLSESSQHFWDRKIRWYNANSYLYLGSFYYYGSAGTAAWLWKCYIEKFDKTLRDSFIALIDAKTLEEQKAVYDVLEERLFGTLLNKLIVNPFSMSLLGVPRAQINVIDQTFPGGIKAYVKHKLRQTFTEVPIVDNYFWRVYIHGNYSKTCCPEYLKEENFEILQSRVDRIKTHCCTLTQFLQENPNQYTHYVLLDHQDWMVWHSPDALNEEWETILKNTLTGTKIMLRSAALNDVVIPAHVKDRIRIQPELTEPIHSTDRVGTYGSLHLAEAF